MKWMLTAALAVTSLAPIAALHAQSVRHGTIVDMQPIDNRGKDESETHKLGRHWGATLGNIVGIKTAQAGGGSYAGNAAAQVAPTVGDKVGGDLAGEGPAAHYMVKLQMDDGKVVSTVQTGQAMHSLHTGDKVAVSGTGGNMTLSAD